MRKFLNKPGYHGLASVLSENGVVSIHDCDKGVSFTICRSDTDAAEKFCDDLSSLSKKMEKWWRKKSSNKDFDSIGFLSNSRCDYTYSIKYGHTSGGLGSGSIRITCGTSNVRIDLDGYDRSDVKNTLRKIRLIEKAVRKTIREELDE